jgi:hypothetical protein
MRATRCEGLWNDAGDRLQGGLVFGQPALVEVSEAGTSKHLRASLHNFPADGEYVFKLAFQHTTTVVQGPISGRVGGLWFRGHISAASGGCTGPVQPAHG